MTKPRKRWYLTRKRRAGKRALRRPVSAPTSLTEAVRRVLVRISASPQPFGVFDMEGSLVIYTVSGPRFSSLSTAAPDSLIGIYDRNVTITGLIDDLKCHFPERPARA